MKYNKDSAKTKIGIRALTYCTLFSASLFTTTQVHAATDPSASTTSAKTPISEETDRQTQNATSDSAPENPQESSPTTNDEEKTEVAQPATTEASKQNIVRAANETIDDWMPDKNLQKAVAAQYEITVDQLTKDYISSNYAFVHLKLTDDVDLATTDNSYYYVKSLQGLEFISELRSDIKLYHTNNESISIDMSYLLALKTDPSKWHHITVTNENADFTNFSLFWDYLNYSSESALDNSGIEFALVDDSALGRSSSVSRETTFNDYKRLVIPISTFYKKGTDIALDSGYNIATLFIRPDREPSFDDLDFDTSDEHNSDNFLDYVLVNDGHNDLVYAVYLEDDNLVFKLKKGSIENVDSPLNLTTNFEFTHTKVPLYSSLVKGNYTFSTNVALNVQLSSAVIANGTVKVNYEDENGNSIASSETLSGNVGTPYTSVQKSIPGYTFKNLKAGSASVTGVFTNSDQVVTYVYSQNHTPSPTNSTSLTVHYQDAEGNKIAESKTIFGNIGDNYDVSENAGYRLNIAGYTFKEIKGIPTGTLTAAAQTVIYVYTKDTADIVPEPITPTQPGKPVPEKPTKNPSDTKDTNKKPNPKNNMPNKYTANPTKNKSLPKTGRTSGFLQVLVGIALLCTTFGAKLFKRKQYKE